MALVQSLQSLTDSLSSASTSIPDSPSVLPPTEGISLLDTKNELLLTYLQNLVFFILSKIRQHKNSKDGALENDKDAQSKDEETVQNLVKIRLYLEKGVRPLESRLKYQIDKLLAAAASSRDSKIGTKGPSTVLTNGKSVKSGVRKPRRGSFKSSSSKTSSAGSSDEEDDDDDSEASLSIASHSPEDAQIAELSHRPNPAALLRSQNSTSNSRLNPSSSSQSNQIYRPPHQNPTSFPPTTTSSSRPSSGNDKSRKSRLMETYIREEFSTAPTAEPSIGTGSTLRGRAAEKEAERREYEESRLVRLPEEGGGKKARKAEKRRRDLGEGFGEDEILGRGTFEGLDRGLARGKKRRVEGEGGGGGRGMRAGEAWERRREMLSKGRKKGRK